MNQLVPGEDVEFKLALNAFQVDNFENKTITGADVEITNVNSRESENIVFKRSGDILIADVKTIQASEKINLDVLALVLFFGLSMFFATKVMTLTNKNSQQQLDPQQEAMQKTMGRTMPIVLTATFFFIPIPAGVLLYLVVSNLFQIGQTFIINKQLDAAEKVTNVIDVKPEK